MKWVSVKKKLPHKYVNVLTISKFGRFAITCVGADNKLDNELEVYELDKWTHWMHLPEPPPNP